MNMRIVIRIVTLITIAFFGILNSGLQAQNDLFVCLQSGISMPLGQFAGTTLDEDCFARPGISYGGEATWFFLPNFGVGIEANINNNPIDLTSLTQKKMEAEPSLENLSIRSESFQTTTIVGGVYGRYPILEGLTVTGKLLAGYMRSNTPYQVYRAQFYFVGPLTYEITSSRDDGFIVIPGLGMKYMFKRGLGCKLDGEYISRQMSFPFSTPTGVRIDERKVRFIQVLVGFVIEF
jgi:hypothetical protein